MSNKEQADLFWSACFVLIGFIGLWAERHSFNASKARQRIHKMIGFIVFWTQRHNAIAISAAKDS